jgi:iron complex outermembrane receptor protein
MLPKNIPFPYKTLAAALLAALSNSAFADHEADPPINPANSVNKNVVTITTSRPTSLPTQIPTTIEGITGQQIEERINATDSEDALKYLPSLNVRKRYIGDYDHAVLASRASGTGNSARSLVYADGILLSNLLGNGAGYTPRWGLVTPEEIDRVDVLYGPFSAAYPGNSVGAVVDYVTRLPKSFEAHVKLSATTQDFKLYGTDSSFTGKQLSAALGSKAGDWSWWFDVSRLDSNGQPITFANKLISAGVPGNGGLLVTGAIADKNPTNKDWLILGATNQTHTIQDHAKVKLAYDFSPTVRASYILGWWKNDADRTSDSYLRDAAGNHIVGSDAQPNINFGGRQYKLTPADFAGSLTQQEHVIQALVVKSHARTGWNWEAAASVYDYSRDLVRAPTVFLPVANGKSNGTVTDSNGTGWNTLALKGSWRSDVQSAHVVDFGYQRDSYKLRTLVSATTDWVNGAAGSRVSAFSGDTRLQSLYGQDTWRFAPDWKTTLGGRLEQWSAFDGKLSNATTTSPFGERKETTFSPKAALALQATPDWELKASLGRAVRNPTVAELYQGSIVGNVVTNNDPNLKPEKSWTSELTAERALSNGSLRTTVFHEDTRDALYSQTNVTVTPNVTNIQNVSHIRTTGVEVAYAANDVAVHGLTLTSSLTYTNSKIVENDANPASVGKQQPRVPKWRANFLASYHLNDQWSGTFGARYSGVQYSTLDNSDPNGFTYTGFSSFFVTDVRVRYRFAKNWSAAVGIDNLNNRTYFAFHPYPQRTVVAELKWDL